MIYSIRYLFMLIPHFFSVMKTMFQLNAPYLLHFHNIMFYRGFKIGMKCLDDYSNLCLTSDEKNMVSDNVIGAKYTFGFLCHDEAFQKGKLN